MYKKKGAILFVAILIFVSTLLAGTLAWRSFNQSSISVFEGFVNPNVNLHDDFRLDNKDIFVENSGGDKLYIRVALDEWLRLNGTVIQSKHGKLPFLGTDGEDGWLYHNYDGGYVDDCGEDFHKYYQWDMGDSSIKNAKYYLKAPFKTQALFDSKGVQTKEPEVVADLTGENKDKLLFGINPEYDTVSMEGAYSLLEKQLFQSYNENMTIKEYLDSLYEGIANAKEKQDTTLQAQLEKELLDYISKPENGLGYYDKVFDVDENGNVKQSFSIVFVPISRTLEVKNVLTMEEWISYGSTVGEFWVVDTDGWCYWASPLMPNEATGLLITGVTQKSMQSENELSYKLSATLQAATYKDIKSFWDGLDIGGGGATQEAKTLLTIISQGDSAGEPPSSSESGGESNKTTFFADGQEWLVIDENNSDGKSIIISKNILASIQNNKIQMYLESYISAGGGQLAEIIAADSSATALVLTSAQAESFFKAGSDRIATSPEPDGNPSAWWLANQCRVLEDGSIDTVANYGDSGLRVAVELDANALKALISKAR